MRVIRNWLVRGSLVAASVAAMTAASLTPTLSRASAQDGGDPPPMPTAQTRFVYASISSGDDANEGLSPMEPKQSLAAAAGLLRPNSSDWLLLKRGDEWNEGLAGLVPNGASEQTPLVITAYGDGADPRVMPGDASTARPGSNNTRSYGVEFAENEDDPEEPLGRGIGAVGPDGWTNLVPTSDTRFVYISSSEGSDSNNGFSKATPVRTLQRGYALLRNGSPDWLLLKRGDVWVNEQFGRWEKSGRSPEEPMVVGAYGDDSALRPRILSPLDQGMMEAMSSASPRNVAFISLAFEPNGRDNAGDPAKIGVRWLANQSDSILFEDCYIAGYKDNFVFQSYPGDFMMSDIKVRRCVIVDAWNTGGHSQGIFATGVDGLLIEECIFDRNGWNPDIPGAEATHFNRNLYLSQNENVVTRANIDARGASGGIQQRTGGIAELNLSLQNPLGISFGHAENPAENIAGGAIRNNVLLGSRDIADRPRGFGITVGARSEGVDVYGNIVSSNEAGSGNVAGILIGSDVDGMTSMGHAIRENIVYSWYEPDYGGGWGHRGSAITIATGASDLTFEGNILQQPLPGGKLYNASIPISSSWTFTGNTYYTVNDEWAHTSTTQGGVSLGEWASMTGETDFAWEQVAFPDPGRGINTYLSLSPEQADEAVDLFMQQARQQRKGSWDDTFTARAVVNYIRVGFGMPAIE